MNKAHSINPDDVESFERIASEWWDEQGSFKPLHQINIPRMRYIRQRAANHYNLDAELLTPLKGLKILDIGCGGGLVCEPLCRMGGNVTGLDAGRANIEAAKIHADDQGLNINYQALPAEELIEQQDQEGAYDMVLALEILEHVNDPAAFVALVQRFVKPGGLVIFSTLNRTIKSLALGKIAAEYILGLVPKGTHNWQQFIKPSELARWSRAAGGTNIRTQGLIFNPLKNDFQLSETDIEINYFLSATIKKDI